MQATVSLTLIQQSMDMLLRFIAKHATLPILEHVYLKVADNTLTLRACDMEKYLELIVPVDGNFEATTTVNAKMFADILRTIDDEQILLAFKTSEEWIDIISPTDKFTISGIAASEYVAIPSLNDAQQININPVMLSKGIDKVEFAVTEKNFSPIMTGIHIKTKELWWNKYLVFAGTDSFRLAEYKIPVDQWMQDITINIPKMHILDIKKVIEQSTINVDEIPNITMMVTNNMIQFEGTIGSMQYRVMSLLIQWNFPDYDNESIMPSTHNHSILVSNIAMDKAIRKIATITRSLNNYVAIKHDGTTLEISSGLTDVGQASTTLDAVLNGETISFGLNGKFIQDFTRIVQHEELQLNIVSPDKPIMLRDPSDEAMRYVIRPLVK